MDHLDALRLFVRVVERGSFTAAAADLDLPRSTATEALRRLERRLGARLLERTTRHVAPTPDGQAFYERCVAILADMEDAEAVLRDADPRGRLRIDASPLLTRTFLLPHLPAFLERYPRLDIQFGQGRPAGRPRARGASIARSARAIPSTATCCCARWESSSRSRSQAPPTSTATARPCGSTISEATRWWASCPRAPAR